jgi:hypothetical protein
VLLPWEITDGPEFQGSLNAARAQASNFKRFDANLLALRIAIRLNPASAHPFIEERDSARVIQTIDPREGYELTLFFVIHEHDHIVERKWIDLRKIDPDER